MSICLFFAANFGVGGVRFRGNKGELAFKT